MHARNAAAQMGEKIGEKSPHVPKEHLENVEVAFGRKNTDLLSESLLATSLRTPSSPAREGHLQGEEV